MISRLFMVRGGTLKMMPSRSPQTSLKFPSLIKREVFTDEIKMPVPDESTDGFEDAQACSTNSLSVRLRSLVFFAGADALPVYDRVAWLRPIRNWPSRLQLRRDDWNRRLFCSVSSLWRLPVSAMGFYASIFAEYICRCLNASPGMLPSSSISKSAKVSSSIDVMVAKFFRHPT